MSKISSIIDNALIQFFNTATGITVVWERQDAIRPALPYISLSIQEIEDESGHQPDVSFDGSLRTLTYRNIATLRVRVFSNTDASMGYLRDAIKYRYKLNGKLTLSDAGICIRSIENIIDFSEMIDTNFELKAQANFIIAYSEEATDTDFQVVRISGSFNNADYDADNTPII